MAFTTQIGVNFKLIYAIKYVSPMFHFIKEVYFQVTDRSWSVYFALNAVLCLLMVHPLPPPKL